ncbi:hypothetical protein Hanom_Chr17g01574831 [Helianthus anomalus]
MTWEHSVSLDRHLWPKLKPNMHQIFNPRFISASPHTSIKWIIKPKTRFINSFVSLNPRFIDSSINLNPRLYDSTVKRFNSRTQSIQRCEQHDVNANSEQNSDDCSRTDNRPVIRDLRELV